VLHELSCITLHMGVPKAPVCNHPHWTSISIGILFALRLETWVTHGLTVMPALIVVFIFTIVSFSFLPTSTTL
jgi:hypothetical protein